MEMLDTQAVEAAFRAPMRGFESVRTLHECTYRDSSTVMVCPTRGMIPQAVVEAILGMITVPNQKRSVRFVSGAEVADAYNKAIAEILGDWQLSKYRYILTFEDDNLPPIDGHLRLLDAIQSGPWDAVSGIYFTRRSPPTPLAIGDPAASSLDAMFDWKTRDVRAAIEAGETVEVNGLPMGFTLFKMDLFREMPAPWFRTVNEYVRAGDRIVGRRQATHDLDFCERARTAGKRFAVDCGVKVGHLDVATGVVY
jgi:hypothetical protein